MKLTILENPEASFFGCSKNPSAPQKNPLVVSGRKIPHDHHPEGTDALVEVVVILVMVVVVSVVEVPVLKGRLRGVGAVHGFRGDGNPDPVGV